MMATLSDSCAPPRVHCMHRFSPPALWLASSIVGSINSVPLLPKLMELIGLGYSCWFVYRYLLFKDSRSELGDEVEAFKAKISGEDEA